MKPKHLTAARSAEDGSSLTALSRSRERGKERGGSVPRGEVVTPPIIPTGELLTKKEMAARLKVTVRTIENWQQRGIIEFVKVGKIVRFDWAEVVEQLKANFRVSRKADVEGDVKQ